MPKLAALAVLVAVILLGGVTTADARVSPVPAGPSAHATAGGRFVPHYIGDFPPEALAAWDKVNDALLRHLSLTVDVEVQVEWKDIPNGYIGMGGSSGSQINFAGAPMPDTWYPNSLANQLAGTRISTAPDVGVDMSSTVKWEFTGDPKKALREGSNDYVTTLMHEILHGMGFSGTADYNGGEGRVGDGDGVVDPDRRAAHLSTAEAARRGSSFLCVVAPAGYTSSLPLRPSSTTVEGGAPAIWDHFVVDGDGHSLLDSAVYANPSPELGTALTSDKLFWSGAGGSGANGGKPVKLYVPAEWSPASSYSHLDDKTYDGGPDSILTSAGEKMPDIELGPRVIGMLGDMGWATR